MILPPKVVQPVLEWIGLVGEKLVVASIEAAVRRTRAAQLKRNMTFFQRLFSRKAPP